MHYAVNSQGLAFASFAWRRRHSIWNDLPSRHREPRPEVTRELLEAGGRACTSAQSPLAWLEIASSLARMARSSQ